MTNYKISGVWKNTDGVITHYAVHTQTENGHTRAVKKTKHQVVAIVETTGNTVQTWMWNYTTAFWTIGEGVHVVDGANGKYLRSNRDNKVTDNLGHLIDYDWLSA
ncbi:MAG: DUF3892 domain-containing protein [Bacteroidota bacterium]